MVLRGYSPIARLWVPALGAFTDGITTKRRNAYHNSRGPKMSLLNDIQRFISWHYDVAILAREGKGDGAAPRALVDLGDRLTNQLGSGAVAAMATKAAAKANAKVEELKRR